MTSCEQMIFFQQLNKKNETVKHSKVYRDIPKKNLKVVGQKLLSVLFRLQDGTGSDKPLQTNFLMP